MLLRWTVLVDATAEVDVEVDLEVDVVVDCPEGALLGSLDGPDGLTGLVALAGLAGAAGPGEVDRAWTAAVDGVPVGADAVVGRVPLLDGARLALTPADDRADAASGAPSSLATRVPGHLLEVVVLAGPDAGRTHPLRRRQLTCGRAPGSDVAILDPRLSRAHCRLVVGPEGVSVVDLGSTNGTHVGGAPTGSAGSPLLRLDEECRLGGSVAVLRQADPGSLRQAAPETDGTGASPEQSRPPGGLEGHGTADGTRVLRRSPRDRPPERVPSLRLPVPAQHHRSSGFPLLAVVLPAVAGGALAFWTGSAVYLLLAALGPVMATGAWWGTHRTARREGALGAKGHAQECARLRSQAQVAAADLAAARRHCMPDAHALLRQAEDGGARVWERGLTDDDALRLRLGTAPVGSGVPPGTGDPDGADDGTVPMRPIVRVLDHRGHREDVVTSHDLVAVDLRDGALGLVEVVADQGAALARFVVGQLTVLLPPGELEVLAVVGAAAVDRWRWLWLLPHVLPGAVRSASPTSAAAAARAVAEVVERRRAEPTGRTGQLGTGPAAGTGHRRRAVLVVLDDPAGEVPVADLGWLEDAHQVDVHVVCVASRREQLPHGCRTLVVPASPDAVEVLAVRPRGGSSAVVVADRVGPWWADAVARALAPLRSPAAEGPAELPARVHLDELVDTSAAAVARRWSKAPGGSLAVPLGIGADGVAVVDLVRDGPHALLAGTTGSGKSELLRAWLLGLAALHPPEQVVLLLVDYKGGATFDDLADLPHTVGLLTDLDGGATARVLHALRAEVRRRERLLAAADARDLDAYQTMRPSGAEPLPRLLVVVDEFRVLAEEAPDVLSAFVRLAATGRSLGVHLVLATQRPGGVVSADIRANASLRICLRVQDAGESRDVVDRPDAARLPADRPGRAVVVGAGVDVTVQSAWLGATGDDETLGRGRVRAASARPPVQTRPGTSAGPSPAAVVVQRLRQAATQSDRGTAVSPWLAPLPDRIEAVPGRGRTGRRATAGGSMVTRHDGLLLGITDLPWQQAYGHLVWDPVGDGPALVLGGPRSGRSTTLATAAAAAQARGVPVVRLSGRQQDGDHVADVLAALTTRAAQGSGQDQAVGAATPTGGRASVGSLAVLVLVDDTDELLDASEEPAVVDLLVQLVRSGHRDGIGVMLAGGRATAISRLAGGARLRLVHRATDRADALVAGVPSRVSATSTAPGRCLVVGQPGGMAGPPGAGEGGHGEGVVEAQVHLVPDLWTAPVATPGWLPRPLPRTVAYADLPAPGGGGLPIGVAGPDGVTWSLPIGASQLWVVAGPAGSGRTSCLRLLHEQALRAGLVVATLDATSRPEDGGHPRSPSERVDLLLLDDADRLDAASLEAVDEWVTHRRGTLESVLSSAATVVVAGAVDWFSAEFRGVPGHARRQGRGLVLDPGRTDVRDVLGLRTAVVQRVRAPGRGLVVDRGRVCRLQVGLPSGHAVSVVP